MVRPGKHWPPEGFKQCGKCREAKPLSEFHKQKGGALGLAGSCTVCRKAYQKKWRFNNRERLREKDKAYRSTEDGKKVAAKKDAKYLKTAKGKRKRKHENERAKTKRLVKRIRKQLSGTT